MQIKTNSKILKSIAFTLLITLIALIAYNTAIAQDYTLCAGESIEVGPFPDPPPAQDGPDGPEGSGYYGLVACIVPVKNISPANSVVSNTANGYIVSPLVTTTYTYTTYYGQGSPNGCNPGDVYSETFTVYVEECGECEPGSSPDCPEPMRDYTICEGDSVETIIFPLAAFPDDVIDGLLACDSLIGDISPQNGVISQISDGHISYILAPTTTTTYMYRTYYGPSKDLPNCNLGETFYISFTVNIVEDCLTKICAGETTTLSDFTDPPFNREGPPNTYACSNIVRSISPNNGVVCNNGNSFEVAPTETTTYTITSQRLPLEPDSQCTPGPEFTESFTVYVEQCGIVICTGDTTILSDLIDPPFGPQGPTGTYPCSNIVRSISPNDGIVSNNGDSFEVAPAGAGAITYTVTSQYLPLGPGSECIPGPEFTQTFKVYVGECEPCDPGSSPKCPYLFEDYTICEGDSVTTKSFPHPPTAVDYPGGIIDLYGEADTPVPACISPIGDISPSDGVVSQILENGQISYKLAPTTTTTYTYTTYYGPSGGVGSMCNPGDIFTLTFTVFVEECVPCESGPSPDCPVPFEDYKICADDSVTTISFPHPYDAVDNSEVPACTTLIGEISPLDGVVSQILDNGYISYILAPSETTTYTYTTYYGQSETSPDCNPGETFSLSFTVYVAYCHPCELGSSPNCPQPIQDYTICEGETVETISFPHPYDAIVPDGVQGCTTLIGDISPQDGVVSKISDNYISYILGPSETTTYTFTTYYGPSETSPGCYPGETYSISFTVFVEECIPASTPENPYVIESCPGEQVRLRGYDVDVPEPPITVIDDVGGPDFRYVDYRIDGPDGNVCKDCTSARVSPQVTTLYSITWKNGESDLPRDRVSGTRYFLVEVQDCSTEVDLIAPYNSPDIKFHVSPTQLSREGELDINVDFYNNGPGYVESVDFIWEINGIVVDTTFYNSTSVLPGNTLRAILYNYFFEATTDYTIKVTATNINDGVDLNPQDNVYEFFLPAFDPAPDLVINIIEPTNPILGPGDVVVEISNLGNAYVFDFVINWSINGDLRTPFIVENASWNLSRPAARILSFNIGSKGFNPANDYEIIAWVEPLDDYEDINLTNNIAIFNYSADDRAYYNADESITICEGDQITLSQSSIFFDISCFQCRADIRNPVWTFGSDILNNTDIEITITPTESGFINFDSDTYSECIDFCEHPKDGPPPGASSYGPHSYKYGIIVLPCDNSSLVGCTDASAPNYNPNAILDDGSCADETITICQGDSITIGRNKVYSYHADCYECPHDFISPVWTLGSDTINTTDGRITIAPTESSFYNFNSDTDDRVNCYIFDCYDPEGVSKPPDYVNYGLYSYKYDIIVLPCDDRGCTDACAPNYNPEATLDDGSCEDYDIPDCPEDTCEKYYGWDTQTCSCEVVATPSKPCNDGDPCTNDYLDYYCECVHSQIQGCATCEDPCAPNFGEPGDCELYDIPDCGEDTCTRFYYWNSSSCRCISMDKPIDCDDYNECTEDYLDNRSCQCINEVIPGCGELCDNEPGLMQTASTFVCSGNTVYMREIFSVVNENSVKAYVLHEGKNFNGTDYILIQESNRFDSPGKGYTNQILYISAVIGPAGADGYPKLDDDCTVWTPYGAYVVFFDPLTVTLENERCESGQYFVDVSVNGGTGGISQGLVYASITDGNLEYNNVGPEEVKTFGPYEGAGDYTIEVKDVKGCSVDFTGTYQCRVLYKVLSPSSENGSYVITHSNPGVEIKSVAAYSLNGQVAKSNAVINGSSCRVEIQGNKGIYLVELLLSNNELDYIKIIK